MKQKTIQKITLCGILLMLISLTSCAPEETFPPVDYNITDLFGKWQSGTLYYRYNNDAEHTGVTWDEADDITEAEGQPFVWELDENNMIHIHKMEMGADVPKHYILMELTPTTLRYADAVDTHKKYTFTKVNETQPAN